MAKRSENQSLFKTKIVPGKAGSGKLFEEELVAPDSPVECLGGVRSSYRIRRMGEGQKFLSDLSPA